MPAFRLHAIEEPMRVDEVLADFDGYMSSADHVEFYWVPHTGWALTKRNRRTDEPAAPRGRRKEFVDDILLQNVGFGALCRIGRRFPNQIPRLAKILPSTGRTEYTDRSDKVFTSPRRVHFYEMEYGIPREAVPEALNRVRRLVDEAGIQLSFPVEVRVVAPDDSPLSTAHGRPTGYIAIHVYQGTPYDAYFQGVERIMDGYGGRPHWGKMHFQRAETLADRYPRWDDFQAVRRRVDPDGRFTNQYLDRVLGAGCVVPLTDRLGSGEQNDGVSVHGGAGGSWLRRVGRGLWKNEPSAIELLLGPDEAVSVLGPGVGLLGHHAGQRASPSCWCSRGRRSRGSGPGGR